MLILFDCGLVLNARTVVICSLRARWIMLNAITSVTKSHAALDARKSVSLCFPFLVYNQIALYALERLNRVHTRIEG